MKKSKKMYYFAALGIIFLLAGVVISIDGGEGDEYIYFGAGTLAATVLYYGIMAANPQIIAFIVGLVVLYTGVVLIVKGELIYPTQFGIIIFIAGILVLLNSGFSEFIRDRKKKK
ncbi:MAG: hypothetical protein GWP12_01365 [Nitrospirae bacterium]|nr:hypothetical protein [Nitrospirota bacterium]